MTPFGKAVRHLRIEHEKLLGEMADALNMSPSYLSQIETGRKPIPPKIVDQIATVLNLETAAVASLREAAALSQSEFKISLDSDARPRDRVLANDLAMEFARLTPEAKEEIERIVKGGRGARN